MEGGAGEAWKSCHAKKCACRECQVNEMPPSRYIAHSEPICCNFQIKQRAKRVASAITTQKRSMARWRGHRCWRGSGHYMLQTWRTTTVIVTSTSAAKESTIERSCAMANHRSADRWSVINRRAIDDRAEEDDRHGDPDPLFCAPFFFSSFLFVQVLDGYVTLAQK